VIDATAFPISGDFRIKIEDEILVVTDVSSLTFTITRGVEGTIATTHESGADVIHLLTKGGLEARVANRFVTDLYDNKPVAGVKGRLFMPTDGLFLEYDDGADWHKYGPFKYLKAPPESGWEWVNQGTATANFVGSTLVVEDPDIDSNTTELRLYVRPLQSATQTLTVAFTMNGISSDYPKVGVCMYNPDSGQFSTWGLRFYPSSTYYYRYIHQVYYNSTTSSSGAGNFDGKSISQPDRFTWFRFSFVDDDKTLSVSADGINWVQWYSVAVNYEDYPMRFGVFVDSTENRGPVSVSLIHWEES